MSFLGLEFYIFFPVFLILYYIIPNKYRYLAIFVGSYIFYGYFNKRILAVMIAVTLVSYIGGLFLEKNRNKNLLGFFFGADVLILLIFKYFNFIIKCINEVIIRMNLGSVKISQVDILLPVGLSFIVFQSCTYLTDVYRGNIDAEYNLLRYGAFVSFFPTVLSGPIQKARELLPQLKNPVNTDYYMAEKGTVLFVWGLFQKIMVANRLKIIVDTVFDNYRDYNSTYYIIAAVSFSLYIYADFSSYSDIARGLSMIMGINIGKNFDAPYMSVTTSEFWNRWHMSLNSWFVENVYIPLGGNRHGKLRKYINVMIVFLISGLWHGADYHYIMWGFINGLLVISGQMLYSVKKNIYKRINIDDDVDSIVFIRRIIVFYIITLTWIFFRNGIGKSLYLIKSIVLCNPVKFCNPELFNISGSVQATFITVIATYIFCNFQIKRHVENNIYEKYGRQPFIVRSFLLACIIVVCVFALCSTDADINTSFLYFDF